MIKSIFKWFAILIVCAVLVVAAGVGFAWYDHEQMRSLNQRTHERAQRERDAMVAAQEQAAAAAKQEAAKQEQAAAAAAAEAQLVPVELRRDWYRRVPSWNPVGNDFYELYIRFTATNIEFPSRNVTIKVSRWVKDGLHFKIHLPQTEWVDVGPLMGGDRRTITIGNSKGPDWQDTLYAR